MDFEKEIKMDFEKEIKNEENEKTPLEKVVYLIGKRLDYLIECHDAEDGTEAMSLIKTDELIKIAKFLKEMEDGAKMQVESEQSDEDEHVRFVLDKSVRRLAK